MKFISALLSTILVLLLSTSAFASQLGNPEQWRSGLQTNHALVGKIWSRKKQAFVSVEELEADLKTKRYILLGEKHDNPDHHWLQAQIINKLANAEIKPSVVMEMIRVDQMQRVESFLAQKDAKAEHMGTALLWEANGWPDWKLYQPIGEKILEHKLEIYPGLASRQLNNHLIKKNIFALPENSQKAFKLDVPLEPEHEKTLIEEVRTVHCNKLPERVIKPMANVQRFRDAWMADVMITASQDDQNKQRQVILIAGSGHTRDDRGAPWYLRKRAADHKGPSDTLSIQFTEADETAKTVQELSWLDPNGKVAADYVWVTPAVKRGNYCDSIPDFGKKKH